MATKPSPLEQLKTLVDEQAGPAIDWRDSLPTLRAQASATSAVLSELAQAPPTHSPPQREYVDIVLAAPSRNWAEDIAGRLRQALPLAQVELGVPGERLPDASPPGYTVRCQVSLPGFSNGKAVAEVRAALAQMHDLEVDYSEPVDLIVVTPRG
jgi:hypothetical protein